MTPQKPTIRVPLSTVEMLPFRRLLERVAEGETIEVTHGHRVVAVVSPALAVQTTFPGQLRGTLKKSQAEV